MLDMALKLHGLQSAVDALGALDDQASGAARWHVAPSADYAPYVEYGTSRSSAQPFMRPAAEAVQADVGRHVAQATSLEDALQSVALAVEADAKERAPVDTGNLRSSISARKVE